jgi:hypothetical protein
MHSSVRENVGKSFYSCFLIQIPWRLVLVVPDRPVALTRSLTRIYAHEMCRLVVEVFARSLRTIMRLNGFPGGAEFARLLSVGIV